MKDGRRRAEREEQRGVTLSEPRGARRIQRRRMQVASGLVALFVAMAIAPAAGAAGTREDLRGGGGFETSLFDKIVVTRTQFVVAKRKSAIEELERTFALPVPDLTNVVDADTVVINASFAFAAGGAPVFVRQASMPTRLRLRMIVTRVPAGGGEPEVVARQVRVFPLPFGLLHVEFAMPEDLAGGDVFRVEYRLSGNVEARKGDLGRFGAELSFRTPGTSAVRRQLAAYEGLGAGDPFADRDGELRVARTLSLKASRETRLRRADRTLQAPVPDISGVAAEAMLRLSTTFSVGTNGIAGRAVVDVFWVSGASGKRQRLARYSRKLTRGGSYFFSETVARPTEFELGDRVVTEFAFDSESKLAVGTSVFLAASWSLTTAS